MNFIEVFKKNKLSMILMAITAALIIACIILFKPDFIMVLPYFVSLVIGALQASANRYAPLIGGVNSILYALVYYYLGLNGNALYALLISFPLQIITFIRWQKNKYGSSTVFKKMSWGGRALTALIFALSVVGFRAILNMMEGSQQLLDSMTTLFGILITVLTMLSYVEYSYLAPISGAVGLVMNFLLAFNIGGGTIALATDGEKKIHIIIFGIYSLICVTRGFFRIKKLYKEQQNTVNK